MLDGHYIKNVHGVLGRLFFKHVQFLSQLKHYKETPKEHWIIIMGPFPNVETWKADE